MKKIFPLFGILFALGAVLFSHPGLISLLWQPSAICIVLGATLGVTVAQTSSKDLYLAAHMLKWLWEPPTTIFRKTPELFQSLAKDAKSKGGVAMYEQIAHKQKDTFMKNMFLMLADNQKAEQIKSELDLTLRASYQKHKDAIHVFESAAGYAPTIGIIGSVLGILSALSNTTQLSDSFASIGSAFVATFYGLAIANLILYPIANRLKAVVNQLHDEYQIIAMGAKLLASNENSVRIKHSLNKAIEDYDVYV